MNELLAEGHLKQPIDLSKLSKHDSAALNACIRSLLQKSKDDAAQREALLERSRTMVYEFDRTQGKLAKAEEKAHAEGKESELLASKLQQASRDLATERSMHAVCKENLQKSRNALANVKAIAAQDTKRRERETQAILQRWQKLASLPQHHSLDSSYQSTLRQSSSPVASSSNPEPKIELLNACLQDSEMARQELLEHNAGWRDAFSHAISSLSDTLSEYGIPIPPINEDDLSSLSPSAALSHLNPLLEQVEESLSTFAINFETQRTELQDQVQRILSMHKEEIAVWDQTKVHHAEQVTELEGQLRKVLDQVDELQAKIREHTCPVAKAPKAPRPEPAPESGQAPAVKPKATKKESSSSRDPSHHRDPLKTSKAAASNRTKSSESRRAEQMQVEQVPKPATHVGKSLAAAVWDSPAAAPAPAPVEKKEKVRKERVVNS